MSTTKKAVFNTFEIHYRIDFKCSVYVEYGAVQKNVFHHRYINMLTTFQSLAIAYDIFEFSNFAHFFVRFNMLLQRTNATIKWQKTYLIIELFVFVVKRYIHNEF